MKSNLSIYILIFIILVLNISFFISCKSNNQSSKNTDVYSNKNEHIIKNNDFVEGGNQEQKERSTTINQIPKKKEPKLDLILPPHSVFNKDTSKDSGNIKDLSDDVHENNVSLEIDNKNDIPPGGNDVDTEGGNIIPQTPILNQDRHRSRNSSYKPKVNSYNGSKTASVIQSSQIKPTATSVVNEFNEEQDETNIPQTNTIETNFDGEKDLETNNSDNKESDNKEEIKTITSHTYPVKIRRTSSLGKLMEFLSGNNKLGLNNALIYIIDIEEFLSKEVLNKQMHNDRITHREALIYISNISTVKAAYMLSSLVVFLYDYDTKNGDLDIILQDFKIKYDRIINQDSLLNEETTDRAQAKEKLLRDCSSIRANINQLNMFMKDNNVVEGMFLGSYDTAVSVLLRAYFVKKLFPRDTKINNYYQQIKTSADQLIEKSKECLANNSNDINLTPNEAHRIFLLKRIFQLE